jgi:hypothetical protein
MKKVCSWCQKELSPGDGSDQKIISHGICKPCMFHVRAGMGMEFSEYLSGLGVPIAVLDCGRHVQLATATLKQILGKNDAQIIGNLGGVVFECEYSYLPEGCGNTTHCGGCTVKNTVIETYDEGKSHSAVEAYLNQRTPGGGMRKLKLTISTEKMNDVVLLRVDNIEILK